MPSGVPAGQYARVDGSTTAFSNFTVGDVVSVQNTSKNDGIYTVNFITNDGVNSYLGLSGTQITQETDQTDVDIIPITVGGNRLIALGDEDSGFVHIWSYSESSNSSSGTYLQSPSTGTSGWSTNSIAPVINGSSSKFIFTPGQSALRVCDSNVNNNSLIKHFSYFNTTQFRTADRDSNKYSTQNGTGVFVGWQEHDNFLAKPVMGRLFTNAEELDVNHNVKEFYGIAED